MKSKYWKIILTWLYGLFAAFITSAVTPIAALVFDRHILDDNKELKLLGWIAFCNGVMGAALYLKQSPLPGINQVEIVTKKETIIKKETHPIESIEQAKQNKDK